jgi:hypothetical protein
LKLIDNISDGRAIFKQPPNELLRMIFIRAIAPSFLTDSSLDAGPNSPWCEAIRTMKSIAGVCKAWWHVGVELMYQEISIRRVGQMAALLRTLDANNDIGSFVKSIEISCFLPPGYLLLFKTDIRRIFDYCPRVTRLVFTAADLNEDALLYIALTSAQHDTFSNLTRLECVCPVDCVDLIAVLQVCTNVRFLWICIDGPNDGLALNTPLCLAHLETLRLTVGTFNERHLQKVALHWQMPSLKNVIVYELNEFADAQSLSDREEFFRAFGIGLQYLHIRPYRACGNTYPIDVQRLLDRCPALKHLAVCPSLKLPTQLSHQSIKWIDLWTSPKGEDEIYLNLRNSLSRRKFPSLLGVRELDHGLSVMTDWPAVLPPNSEVDESGVEYRFPGIHVQQTARGIFKRDLLYCGEKDRLDYKLSDKEHSGENINEEAFGEGTLSGEDPEITSNSDSSYVSTDDVSDSSDDSDADATEQDVEEPADEVDHDTALIIFAQTLD